MKEEGVRSKLVYIQSLCSCNRHYPNEIRYATREFPLTTNVIVDWIPRLSGCCMVDAAQFGQDMKKDPSPGLDRHDNSGVDSKGVMVNLAPQSRKLGGLLVPTWVTCG